MRRLAVSLLILVILWASATTFLTTVRSFVAGGSDSVVTIHGVPLWNQLVTLFLVSCAWSITVWIRMGSALRWTIRAGGLAALALSTHLIVFNFMEGTLDEHWFNFRFVRATLDAADGLGKDWTVQRYRFGISLVHRETREHSDVFTGIPPWHIDIEPTLRAQGL